MKKIKNKNKVKQNKNIAINAKMDLRGIGIVLHNFRPF